MNIPTKKIHLVKTPKRFLYILQLNNNYNLKISDSAYFIISTPNHFYSYSFHLNYLIIYKTPLYKKLLKSFLKIFL